MASSSSSPSKYPVISQIPIDFFVYKKFLDIHGNLRFTDSCGDLVFKVVGGSSSRVLVDSSGNPLISINPTEDGGWQGFRGDGNSSSSSKDLMFRVGRSSKSRRRRRRRELEVFLVGDQNNSAGDGDGDGEDSNNKSDFKIRGCPFQRSCTIYRDNCIVAQTSLLYKLGKIIVGRRKFRLTLFPGLFVDHVLVVIALVAVFLD